MRRFKQQLSAEETERILQTGKYCVMAVSGDDDYPYAVPVNYVYDGASVLQLIPKTAVFCRMGQKEKRWKSSDFQRFAVEVRTS